jgi:phosphoglycolate phosphatase-like HAD superfamily hydrolase
MKTMMLSVFSFLFATVVHAKAPVMYFDLGDTIVDTKDMKHIHYYQGALNYLLELKSKGYQLGMITNIPETFGSDYDAKLLTLKKLISDNWDDTIAFNWDIFDDIILPLKNTELKPNPVMFEKAIAHAQRCPVSYISESAKEITAATNIGLATHLFVLNAPTMYVPVNSVKAYLKDNYKIPYDEDCFKDVP